MRTGYKFIHFRFDKADSNWRIINNRHLDQIGQLDYYPTWKKWVFTANETSVFSADCLQDVIDFMGQLVDK